MEWERDIAVIDGVCHLFSDDDMFTVKEINNLFAQDGWLFNLHRGYLSLPNIWEAAECNLPFLGITLSVVFFFPILHMWINGLSVLKINSFSEWWW